MVSAVVVVQVAVAVVQVAAVLDLVVTTKSHWFWSSAIGQAGARMACLFDWGSKWFFVLLF